MYKKLYEFIESSCISNDSEKELIELNTRRGKDTFYDADDFRNAYLNYIITKYKNNDKLTDKDNNCQVVRAFNTIYLDGDWVFNDNIKKEDYEKVSIKLALLYSDAWFEELSNNIDGIDFYDFKFIPTEFPNGKGGFHVLIICNKKISKDLRMNMYNDIKNKLIHNSLHIINECLGNPIDQQLDYEKLFDYGPLQSAQLLLPFAQKAINSRKYYLYDTSFEYSSPQLYFILPHQHTSSLDYELTDKTTITSISVLDDIDPNIKNLLMEINDYDKDNFKNLGTVGKIVADFMSSLIYLSPHHIFWKRLSDNGMKLDYILSPLIRFIYVNYVIEYNAVPNNTNNSFVHSITRMLLPLLKFTTRNSNEKTKRDTYESCLNHVQRWYNKYSGVNSTFNDESIEVWRNRYNPPKDNQSEDDKKRKAEILNKLLLQIRRYFNSWIKFVTDTVMAGITDEIRPFKEKINETTDPHQGVTFDDVMPKQASVNSDASMDVSFYIKTLRKWCVMFMFAQFYETKSINESIRAILTAFSRYYIWHNKSNTSGNTNIYIYNIKQTKLLCKYPYNQWMLDKTDGEFLKSWLKSMYVQIIKPELITSNMHFGITPLIDNAVEAKLMNCRLCKKAFVPLSNFDQDMKNMFNNIIGTFEQERWDPPRELDAVRGPYFPMRNGILEFLDDGSIKMHYNNHIRFMDAYTNILWTDEYNYDCDEYKIITKMWNEIFPIEEERDYCLKIFSSALVGTILKDMLIVQYGTGGDGKTISNNAMLGMLGSNGLTSHILLKEDDDCGEYVENPCGLATTMKTETILTSNKSTHDSGGIIQLKNKRLCTVQEPDPNICDGKLNCSRIKEILSGSSITAREIHAKAEPIAPNCIITLQTNLLLAYTEDTDAIRRRITVIQFRSKFSNEINKDKVNTLKYKYKADPNLSVNLINNPRYWQALFYKLLPYAQSLIRDNIKALSDIPRPDSIVKVTEGSFTQSNGLIGWLNKFIEKREGSAICVSKIHETIIREDINSKNTNTGRLLTSNKSRDKSMEIYGQLIGTYMGRIYKVKAKYYNKRKTSLVPGFEVECNESDDDSTIISKYFDEYAVNSFEYSELSDKSDLYIVGYALKIENETENIF